MFSLAEGKGRRLPKWVIQPINLSDRRDLLRSKVDAALPAWSHSVMDWRRTLLAWAEAALDQLTGVKWPLVVLAAIAYLQFAYFDIALQIATLPHVIVFVLVGGAPPPV